MTEARGTGDSSVSVEGDVLDSCCNIWWNCMWPNTQPIKGLYQVSQQYPSTIVQPWSNGVTKKDNVWVSPVGKQIGRSRVWVMTELEVPSIRCSWIGGIRVVDRWLVETNVESINESEDLESTRDVRTRFGNGSDVNESISESGFERADAPRVTIFAWGSSVQSLGCA